MRFDWKSFIKKVAVIAVPIALQSLLTTSGSMVDTMMISSLGGTSVGAVGLCAQFSSLLFACYWGFVGGGMLFFAQYWGAGDDDGINRSYGLTLVCMMSVAAIFAVLGTVFPDTVMNLYTDKPEIHGPGAEYLRIAAFSYPLSVLAMAMSALLRSTERFRIPLVGAICAVVTNITLNRILIYGALGFPVMGIRGAAIATVCSSAVNVAVIYFLAYRAKHSYLFAVKKHFLWKGNLTREYFRKCFPIILNELFIGFGNMAINMVLGRQSVEAIAALAVFRTLEGLVIGFFAGFSNAATILVGTEVGAGNHKTAYERAKRLIYLCMGVIAVIGAMILCLHKPILTLMNLEGESYSICFGLLLIYCAVAIIRMANWCQNDTYRSAGDASYGTILEIVFMYAMVLPCVFLSGLVIRLPFLAVFALCYVDEPIRFVLLQRHMYSAKWIKPVTAEGKAALSGFFAEKNQNR